MQKDDRDRITHLFFVRESSQELLKSNYKVLVMDCTYKTNRYQMPLLIVSGQTALHTNFYVAFCFMSQETPSDCMWVLSQLKGLYSQLELPDPTVIVIDMERGLMAAIEQTFSNTNHLLSIWHLNNNIVIKCKKSFDIKEAWDAFFTKWKTVFYASTEPEFWTLWGRFCGNIPGNCVEYLTSTYLPHRHRFVKCYTDKVLHFDITTTSCGEGGHAVLKRQLGSSLKDLKTVMDGINLLLTNEIHSHLIAFNEARDCFSMDLRKPVFQQLIGLSPFRHYKRF